MTFFSTSCTVQPAGSAATPAAGTIAATACVPRTAGTATASIRERESAILDTDNRNFFDLKRL